jgi:hypothetical protein
MNHHREVDCVSSFDQVLIELKVYFWMFALDR